MGIPAFFVPTHFPVIAGSFFLASRRINSGDDASGTMAEYDEGLPQIAEAQGCEADVVEQPGLVFFGCFAGGLTPFSQ